MKKCIIYYATSNPGKFDEVKRYLAAHEPHIELHQYADDIPELQSHDQEFIAREKAKIAWQRLQRPVLIDDSGIFFDKYHLFPGTMSKLVHQSIGFEGVRKLYNEGDAAHFMLHMVYTYGPDQMVVFKGLCHGKLINPRGENYYKTLPWDRLFIPDGSDKTYAELRGTPDEMEFHYRIRALKQFVHWFKQQSSSTIFPGLIQR